MKKMEKVDDLSYFYSELSRTQAEDVMRRYADKPGSYLLRLGSKHRCYAVTLVLEQRVIAHIVINSPNEKTFYAESEVEFTNMSDLIKYYHDHPVPNCTSNPVSITLKNPIHRFRQQCPYPWQEDPIKYENKSNFRKFYEEPGVRGVTTSRNTFWDNGECVNLRYPPPQPPSSDTRLSTSSADFTGPKEIYEKTPEKNFPNCCLGLEKETYVEPETLPTPDEVNVRNSRFCTKGDYFDLNDAGTTPKVIFSAHSQNTKQRKVAHIACDRQGYLKPVPGAKNNSRTPPG